MQNYTIAIIGLGYVGLPLAMAFAEKYTVIGFDNDPQRIQELYDGIDRTMETGSQQLQECIRYFQQGEKLRMGLYLTDDPLQLHPCTVYIITVPTPIDAFNVPDLRLFIGATKTAAITLNKGDLVIYESTVYPGCTEEIGVPVLEEVSGLRFNIDFFCGYSPERINPGDKQRKLADIKKITSGSTPGVAQQVDALYAGIITAGTYSAPSMKVAEAAKVIENTQRDINIAFINELAKIFDLLDIDTGEVLRAAGTKWNFLPFQPGLVGGHCIGIDPYYLAYRAKMAGYHPEMIVAARKINDSMGEYVAGRVIHLMAKKGIPVQGAEILILGISFKENFADVRNSRVVDIIQSFISCGVTITICDPYASPAAVMKEYGLVCMAEIPAAKKFDGVVVAVNHLAFQAIDYQLILKDTAVLFDVKGSIQNSLVDGRL